ncbi:unnamed protein product [Urochloa humidicola]
MPTAAPGLTFEEFMNMKLKLPRCGQWIVAVIWPFLYLSAAAILAYGFYAEPGQKIKITSLWPGLLIMLWGMYLALVAVVYNYMILYMPHAPIAVREAVFGVGLGWIGIPVGIVTYLVVCFLQSSWMYYTLAVIYPALMAGVIAFWVWLVKTYIK